MSDRNTTPAFAQGSAMEPPTREAQLRAAVVALGDALERQRRIDELSPAARALEQRDIDRIYREASQLV